MTGEPRIIDILDNQQWRVYPGESPLLTGTTAACRLRDYGFIKSVADLAEMPVGSVIKTGVSAYERVA